MAIAVIGGLVSSTILMLLLVPVAYSLLDIAGERTKRTKINLPLLDAIGQRFANVHVTIPVPAQVAKWQQVLQARMPKDPSSASEEQTQTATSGK